MSDLVNGLSPAELAKVTQTELREDPSQLKKDLEILKEWILKSPHLQNIPQDEMFLTQFLRGCKHSLERTKEKIDFFCSVRGSLSEWFGDWNPLQPAIQPFLQAGTLVPLRGYDRLGRYVVLIRPGLLKPEQMKIDDMIKCHLMVMELCLFTNLQAQIKGIVLIEDMTGMSAQHATQLTFPTMKKAVTLLQDAYPTRPKAFHILNMPGVMESIVALFRSFQKEKMRQRQHIHPKGDYSKLQAELGTEILPKEYGGTNKTVKEHTDYWMKEVVANADWLMKRTRFCTDESRRPGKPKLHSDLFGMEGSFRKLEID